MRSGQKFQRKDETKETLEMNASASVEDPLMQSLLDEESGILRAGLLPQLDAATASGSKELLNKISQEGCFQKWATLKVSYQLQKECICFIVLLVSSRNDGTLK